MAKNKKFDIAIHHVGGRSGTGALPIFPPFVEGSLVRIFYEADTSCVEQIEKDCAEYYNEVYVLPFCLSDQKGEETLYLRSDRYASSLIPPIIKDGPLFVENSGFGWDLDIHAVDAEEKIQVTTLDHLLIDNPKFSHIPMPDCLSLDVENAEPKILAGAEEILKTKCIALQCEFDLEETFPGLNKIFKAHNFDISDIQMCPTSFSYHKQMPIGLRLSGVRHSTMGEIIAFKSPEAIVANHADPLTDLIKATMVAIVMFDMEKAYAYMEKIETFANWQEYFTANLDAPYVKFIMHFKKIIATYPQITPIKFSTMFPTSEKRSKRFEDDEKLVKNMVEIQQLHIEGYFQHIDKKEFMAKGGYLCHEQHIEIEHLFFTLGMKEHARRFKDERLLAINNLFRRLGLQAVPAAKKES